MATAPSTWRADLSLVGATYEKAVEAKNTALTQFQSDPRGIGIGIARFGDGFGLAFRLQNSRDMSGIPTEIDGVPVADVRYIGVARAL